MRTIELPNIHRHMDSHQEVADDLGDILGIAGLVIYWQLGCGNWVLAIRHDDGIQPMLEVIYVFQTPDRECAGLCIGDGDMSNLLEMFLGNSSAAEMLRQQESDRVSAAVERRAEQADTLAMRRWIGKKLRLNGPFWS